MECGLGLKLSGKKRVQQRTRQRDLGFGKGTVLSAVPYFVSGGAGADGLRLLMYVTSCQRWGSGSFDQTGIPRRTTPLVRIQKIVPGVACCTSSACKLGAFLLPSAVGP